MQRLVLCEWNGNKERTDNCLTQSWRMPTKKNAENTPTKPSQFAWRTHIAQRTFALCCNFDPDLTRIKRFVSTDFVSLFVYKLFASQ